MCTFLLQNVALWDLWKLRVVMMPTLSSLVTPDVVTTSGATRDYKAGTPLGFRYRTFVSLYKPKSIESRYNEIRM